MITNPFRIDALKRRAHGTGWYNDDDDEDTRKTFNPWARSRPRKLRDPEGGSGLHHAPTEGEVSSPGQEERIKNFQGEDGIPPKSRVATFPGDWPKSPNDNEDNGINHVNHVKLPSLPPDDNTAKETEIEEAETPAEHKGLRKRKRDKLMPWRMAGKEDRDEKREEKKKTQPSTAHLTVIQQVKNVFLSWINLMLVFVPVGIAMGNVPSLKHGQPVVVFVINFLAIIPLAGILSFATEELAKFIGEVSSDEYKPYCKTRLVTMTAF
jgi:Ca2+:H+ antiporter